ncbi:MAG: hypothetical protein NVV72_19760 [Asticcacaulis sp.]|nr:hypothetical protein [Asticcacaulis sp.]
MTRENFHEAESRYETLTLLKPKELTLKWQKKSQSELTDEARKHADLANQFSFFDAPAKPLTPCPYEFSFKWKSDSGTEHSHTCDDWETSTAFFRRRAKLSSEDEALKSLKNTYETDYLNKGMRLAFGTHSRRKSQWLLVGILRVDDQVQHELGF